MTPLCGGNCRSCRAPVDASFARARERHLWSPGGDLCGLPPLIVGRLPCWSTIIPVARPSFPLADRLPRWPTIIPVARPSNRPGMTVNKTGWWSANRNDGRPVGMPVERAGLGPVAKAVKHRACSLERPGQPREPQVPRSRLPGMPPGTPRTTPGAASPARQATGHAPWNAQDDPGSRKSRGRLPGMPPGTPRTTPRHRKRRPGAPDAALNCRSRQRRAA